MENSAAGGGDYHLGKKGPLFAALRSSSVCFWVFAIPARTTKKKEKGARQIKNGGNEWAGPPNYNLVDGVAQRNQRK